eukprot:3554972-Prymnesium_polylepis.1
MEARLNAQPQVEEACVPRGLEKFSFLQERSASEQDGERNGHAARPYNPRDRVAAVATARAAHGGNTCEITCRCGRC